jgi:hypothetical protein
LPRPLLPAPCCQPRTLVIIIAAAQSPSPAACMQLRRIFASCSPSHPLRMLALLQGLVIALWRCVLALFNVNTGRPRRGHVPGRGGGSVPDAAHLKPLSQSTDRCRRSGTCRFLEARKPAAFTLIHADARARTHTHVCARTHIHLHTQEEREGNSNLYICPTTKFERP